MAMAPDSTNHLFWQGQDGNVYVQGDQGVNSAGTWDDNTMSYWINKGYAHVPDPNSQVLGSTSTAPSSSGGASNDAAIRGTQATIDQIPGLLEAALAAERQRFDNTRGAFDTQEGQQRGQYGESTVTNQQNYDSNLMASIRAGSRGLQGLLSLLRGTGAGGFGGTAQDLARDAVRDTTLSDIRGGHDTQKENQTELDNSLSSFLTDLTERRRKADDTFADNRGSIRTESNTKLQDLYKDMAGFYSDAGNEGQAVSWLDKATALTPSIASSSRPNVSAYDSSPISVRAPEISAFAGATEPNVIADPNANRVGSGIFTIGNRERREREQAPVFAGA